MTKDQEEMILNHVDNMSLSFDETMRRLSFDIDAHKSPKKLESPQRDKQPVGPSSPSAGLLAPRPQCHNCGQTMFSVTNGPRDALGRPAMAI